MLLGITIVIFHKQKWLTHIRKIFYVLFSILNKRINYKNNETFGKNNTHFYWKQLENKQEMKASRFMKWNNCIN